MQFSYAVQPEPRGLADAFIIGRDFLNGDSVCLILGDSIFYGQGLQSKLQAAAGNADGALIFAYSVKDMRGYGVVELDKNGKVLSIEEKPEIPRSPYAVTGLYFYDNQVVEIASGLKPSSRGELEITDLNRMYLERGQLKAEVLGRGVAWLDAGTHEDLLRAANFIQTIQDRQGLMIACPEEIAWRMGFIRTRELNQLVSAMRVNHYSDYLRRLLNEAMR